MENSETKTELLPYIEFSYGKLGIVRKIKWDASIGEAGFGRKIIFADEYGEDWGIILRPIPEPDLSRIEPSDEEPEDVGDEESMEGDDIGTFVDGMLISGTVLRYFTPEDEAKFSEILTDEDKFLETCKERVEHHGLKMKMLSTDIRFDRRKITFHFAAEGRVDFRMLVRDLAGIFKCRIELHQIGARDEAKLYIGCGPCGRTLCCRSWLKQFKTIGIKMARAQNLPLNPGKISGNCGRLLCCLNYEFETYLELAEYLPRVGTQKEFEGVPYEVTHINPLNQVVTIQCLVEDERHRKLKITNEEYEAGVLKKRK
ncbi:MAG: regulatory iron-sulfur-containing complex subunit RicT [bacterium]